MDINQINGIIRAVVPAGLAFLVGKGIISEQVVGDILAAALALTAAIWSIYTNAPTQIITTAAANPAVDKVVMKDSAVAAAIPSNKVVGK